jgi:hypothetical protein
MKKRNIANGIKYGIIAGLVSTVVSDITSIIIFVVMGQSLQSFFALLGQSLLTLFGSDAAIDTFWLGLALHYSIGILTGLVVGAAATRFDKFQFNSYKKSILWGIIITQIEGNALFYFMSVIMNIPLSDMLMIYGLGFILHLIWGSCLGSIICYGSRRRITNAGRESVTVEPVKATDS